MDDQYTYVAALELLGPAAQLLAEVHVPAKPEFDAATLTVTCAELDLPFLLQVSTR